MVPVRKGALGAEEDVGIQGWFGGVSMSGGSEHEKRLKGGGSLTGLRESEICAGEIFVSPELYRGNTQVNK